MKIMVNVDDECLEKAITNTIAKHVMRGDVSIVVRDFVKKAIQEPEMIAKLNGLILEVVKNACFDVTDRAQREARALTTRAFSNKGWCEKHGTVALVPGCEDCVKEDEEKRGGR